ncbi:salicylate hydroxylase [Cucurbitaria berberidis CBS 394.84]|uniref:Salicylate hydroxylase n=1 Tax=Cucurbitaria berberidis CBS 394.84 TaxID=1168544 RepID=A0A9P4L6V6_9PLEO|nr:salicylate hydroxylase [Cucurbitaria berberidis CBS 394.84]KAF1843679.1 salicylate hydroxylase [Cucurbitaria berberidis CBS 394.84]
MARHSGERKAASQPLKIIIVGAGFAGICAAVECRLRGMEVILIEKFTNSNQYGDIIDFMPNAGRTIASWDNGRVAKDILKRCVTKAECFKMCTADGVPFFDEPWFADPSHDGYMFAGHRGEMWQIILDYAVSVGVIFRVGRGVEQYLEEEDKAGVRLAGGEEIWGDCVLAADGPKSIARQQVLHLPDHSASSGYAIYRAYFHATPEMAANPLLAEFLRPDVDTVKVWLGKDAHMIGYGWNGGKDIVWVMTHKDTHDIKESWSFPGDKKEALSYISDFSDQCKAICEATPEQQLTDYKLIWRDHLDCWRSDNGLTMLIGDAAHCHLPTSAQGGSQAIEDAQVAAICLQRCGGDVRLALKVTERIRYSRSKATHEWGRTLRDAWHNNVDAALQVENGGEDISNVRRPWVTDLDVAAHAEEHFEHLAEDVRNGRQGTIEELALPAGGNFL